jgi:hypothetical protein
VAGCCEYGDEPSGSGATDLVSYNYDRRTVGTGKFQTGGERNVTDFISNPL